eukprot:11674575-Heterocapsa_arctica.AAC.1
MWGGVVVIIVVWVGGGGGGRVMWGREAWGEYGVEWSARRFGVRGGLGGWGASRWAGERLRKNRVFTRGESRSLFG